MTRRAGKRAATPPLTNPEPDRVCMSPAGCLTIDIVAICVAIVTVAVVAVPR
jgi:hypothetical protein